MRTFVVLIGIFALALLGLAAYLGAFAGVKVTEQEVGPYRFVYRQAESGGFQEVGRTTKELAVILDSIDVTNRAPLQVFYPDGRVEVGFVVREDIRNLSLSDGTTQRMIPRQTMLTATFPWKNPASFVVGFMKVNPALQAYRESNSLAETEAMTMYNGPSILYMQPVKAR